jgi:hypothetical protein
MPLMRTCPAFISEEPYAVESHVDGDGLGWISDDRAAADSVALQVEASSCTSFPVRTMDASARQRASLLGSVRHRTRASWSSPSATRRNRSKTVGVKFANLLPSSESSSRLSSPTTLPGWNWQPFRTINRGLGILNDWVRKDRHRGLRVVAPWPLRSGRVWSYPAVRTSSR